MTEELKQLREALRRVKHEAASLADAQVIALEALTQRPAAQTEREAPYGYCPECGAPGVTRERRPDGDDKCSNGHRYPSRSAHASLPTQPAAQEMPDAVEHYGTVDDLPAAQATPEPDDAQRRFEAGCVVLEYLRDIGAPYRAVHHMLIALHGDPEAKSKATPEPVGEEFGYFRALPFGWEQCGEHDDGAVALYDRPAPGVPEGWTVSAYKAAGLTIQSMAQLKGPDLWKITDAAGNVLNKQGEWEWEPMPSSRDDAFLARCRYATLAEASAALAAAQAKGADK